MMGHLLSRTGADVFPLGPGHLFVTSLLVLLFVFVWVLVH